MQKSHLIHKRFTLPKGCSVSEFVIREIDGEDEMVASRWLASRGSSADSLATAMMNEQLRVSIVEVDGKQVDQPFKFEHWNSRTHRFLIEAWSMLNSVDQDEVTTFLAGAADLSQKSDGTAEIMTEDEVRALQKTA